MDRVQMIGLTATGTMYRETKPIEMEIVDTEILLGTKTTTGEFFVVDMSRVTETVMMDTVEEEYQTETTETDMIGSTGETGETEEMIDVMTIEEIMVEDVNQL
jgi:hypothetical protein